MLPDYIYSRVEQFVQLGKWIKQSPPELEKAIQDVQLKNPWFIASHTTYALNNIVQEYLDKEKLVQWIGKYASKIAPFNRANKTIGIIMAGNIPLVGFHDVLTSYLLGYKVQIKLSSKDDVLLPILIRHLNTDKHINFVSRLNQYDAIIATGSNNTNRYFDYYFGKSPHILRNNRTSIAVLKGDESFQDLLGLAKDILMYFGLGCRNVSKIFIPENYDINVLFKALNKYKYIIYHQKYMNNYDYNCTLFLMKKTSFNTNDFVMLKQENEKLFAPLSCVYYQTYTSLNEILDIVKKNEKQIQCIVSRLNISPFKTIDFGFSQTPSLNDYPDAIDTVHFLTQLEN